MCYKPVIRTSPWPPVWLCLHVVEAQQLLGLGQNPAEVYRVQEVQREVKRQIQKLARSQQSRREQLIERLADDDKWKEAAEESARQKRLQQKQFQKEMSPHLFRGFS